jgi:hypothetical protein
MANASLVGHHPAMVLRFRIPLLTLLAAWLAVALPAWAQDSDARVPAGSYEGIVWSSGELWSITTEFTTDAAGELSGSYVYDEVGGPYLGKLVRFRQTDTHTWLMLWVEESSSGTLEATFAEDFSSFVGLWSTLDDSDAAYPWVGERLD